MRTTIPTFLASSGLVISAGTFRPVLLQGEFSEWGLRHPVDRVAVESKNPEFKLHD